MKQMIRVMALMCLVLCTSVGAGVLPSRSSLFSAANPCFAGTAVCNGMLVCLSSGECPGSNYCDLSHYALTSGNKAWYCLCVGGGASTPDPRNQPGWDCGLVGFSDSGNNPIGTSCYNKANCGAGEGCSPDDETVPGCTICSCQS